jgi:peptidoglycan/xylan/chitin deacetylase (PgdA/CDA1 family)
MAALLAAVISVAADLSSGRGRPRHTAVQATTHPPGGRQHMAGASPQHAALGPAAAVDRVLSYTAYVKLAGHARRDVALTFDDGPSPYTPQVLAVLRRMHAVATFFVIGREAWSADTSDYERPGQAKIVYTGISGGQPGAIILMHDGGGDRSETVAALPRIITRLRQRGFKLVTVSQLVGEDPPPRDQPPPTPLSGGL